VCGCDVHYRENNSLFTYNGLNAIQFFLKFSAIHLHDRSFTLKLHSMVYVWSVKSTSINQHAFLRPEGTWLCYPQNNDTLAYPTLDRTCVSLMDVQLLFLLHALAVPVSYASLILFLSSIVVWRCPFLSQHAISYTQKWSLLLYWSLSLHISNVNDFYLFKFILLRHFSHFGPTFAGWAVEGISAAWQPEDNHRCTKRPIVHETPRFYDKMYVGSSTPPLSVWQPWNSLLITKYFKLTACLCLMKLIITYFLLQIWRTNLDHQSLKVSKLPLNVLKVKTSECVQLAGCMVAVHINATVSSWNGCCVLTRM
jgi:hypothetical protein